MFFHRTRNSAREFLHDQRQFTLDEVRTWWQTAKANYRIVIVDHTPAGYFRLQEVSPWHYQIGLDLAAEFRDKGLGRKVYQAAFNELFSPVNKPWLLSLRVLKSNERAIHLYETLGFKVSEVCENDIEMRAMLDQVRGAGL